MKVLQLLLLLTLAISCQPDVKKRQTHAALVQWQGKTAALPQRPSVNWNGTDSCDLYSGFSHKIVYYIDGDCHACLETLPRIDSIYQTIKTQHSALLVYVYSSNYAHFDKVLGNRIRKLHIPLIYDGANSFFKQNNLSTDPLFHCFLVDKDNKVVIAGSFIANQQMTDLYSKILQSQ